jgi:hypothetical protein
MSIHSPVVADFLTVEDMDGVKEVICREVSLHQGTNYRSTLTFNVFNVVLDFVSKTVTLANELDPSPAGEVQVPMNELLALLGCKEVG